MADLVSELAWRQHGIVARRQLIELGMGSSTISGWHRSGHLHCIRPGIYAVGHRRISQEAQWMAAVHSCPPDSALGFGSAGQSRGIVSLRQRLALHVIIPRRGGADPDGVVVHRIRNLDPADVGLHRGIPTTSATRTVWDSRRSCPHSGRGGRSSRRRSCGCSSASDWRRCGRRRRRGAGQG